MDDVSRWDERFCPPPGLLGSCLWRIVISPMCTAKTQSAFKMSDIRGRPCNMLQGRKSLRLCLAGLRLWCFDPIAEASELPDHSGRTPLPRLFGDRGAPFFVADALMQDQPDQPTLPMGDGPDGLVMSQAVGPNADTQFRRYFLWSSRRHWQPD